MGLDFNAKGIAWTIVKPDGNRMVEINKPLCGFIPWELTTKVIKNNKTIYRNKTSNQNKWTIEDTCHQICKIAAKYNVAISIENLDFSNKKTSLKSGCINSSYNFMLASLATTKFHEALQKTCHKKYINLYIVNPTYSSLGGFVKYGMINKVGVDIAASHWIARQALYGEIYKIDQHTKYIKLHKEAITLPYLSTTEKQSKTCTDKLEWRDVAMALGTNRQQWRINTHQLIQICTLYQDEVTIVGNNPILNQLNDKHNLKKIFNPFEDTVIYSKYEVRVTHAVESKIETISSINVLTY